MTSEMANFLEQLIKRYPTETEFHQAVTEVAKSVWPFIEKNPKYRKAKIMERLVEPDRVIMFRVSWVDAKGEVHVNRGYRVQMNSAIGPYKGGSDFDPKGKTDEEVMWFCQDFMTELARYIGPDTGVPPMTEQRGLNIRCAARSHVEFVTAAYLKN